MCVFYCMVCLLCVLCCMVLLSDIFYSLIHTLTRRPLTGGRGPRGSVTSAAHPDGARRARRPGRGRLPPRPPPPRPLPALPRRARRLAAPRRRPRACAPLAQARRPPHPLTDTRHAAP